MVYEVTLGKDGRATGVAFIDKTAGKQCHATSRAVVLAASSCESVRILLNSKSTQFPNGLANSSGKVGKYLMDTVGSRIGWRRFRCSKVFRRTTKTVRSGGHVYTPGGSTRNTLPASWISRAAITSSSAAADGMPGLDTAAGLEWLTGGSYGAKFKKDARRYYGSFVEFRRPR